MTPFDTRRRPNPRKWTIRKSRTRGTCHWLVMPPRKYIAEPELPFPTQSVALDYVDFRIRINLGRGRR